MFDMGDCTISTWILLTLPLHDTFLHKNILSLPFVSVIFHRLRHGFASVATVAVIGWPKMAYLGVRKIRKN